MLHKIRSAMHLYTAKVMWNRNSQVFVDGKYSRRHSIEFDGGAALPGSSSPLVVPVPLSDPAAVDPEEAFVSALSACHMLWFLSIAAARRFCVDTYTDRAEGVMAGNAHGKLAMSLVTLRPHVLFSSSHRPSPDEFLSMHRQAHEECFIANSVRTEVQCEPVLLFAG